MNYRASFSPHAVRAYRGYGKELRESISEAIEDIRKNPLHGPNIKKLKGALKDYRRYRTGDYRILYSISTKQGEVFIDYIQDRKEAYRGK